MRFLDTWSVEERQRLQQTRDLISGCDELASFDWPPILMDDPPGKERYLPWRRLTRFFASEYGKLPHEWGNLTLYALKALTCKDEELGGKVRMDAGNALAYQRRRRQELGLPPAPGN